MARTSKPAFGSWMRIAVATLLLGAVSSPAWADGNLSLGVAVPGLSVFLGNSPGYYAAPPVYYAAPPPRPVYYVPAPPPPPPPRFLAPGYYVQPAPVRFYGPRPWGHRGPPPWAGRWRHGDRDGWRH